MKRKKYNSIEAVHLILSGKKICYEGHAHPQGNYFDVSYAYGYETNKISPQIVEHHGDGSIYKKDVNIIDNRLFINDDKTKDRRFILKKNWIIAKPQDFGLTKFPVTKRRNPYPDSSTTASTPVKKSFFKRLLGEK